MRKKINMEIEKIKQKKAKLEEHLFKLILEFENETQCKLDYIGIHNIDIERIGQPSYSILSSIKINVCV